MNAKNLAVLALAVVVSVLGTHYLGPLKPSPSRMPNTAVNPNPASPFPAPPVQASAQQPPVFNRPPGPPPVPFITPDIRARMDKARQAALAANPALKSEEDDLNKQRRTLTSQQPPASMQDRTALMTKWKDHGQKMRASMAKADPTLQPIFDNLDAQIKARQQQMHYTPVSGTVPLPTTPPTPSPSH